jgi:hypothetical protein
MRQRGTTSSTDDSDPTGLLRSQEDSRSFRFSDIYAFAKTLLTELVTKTREGSLGFNPTASKGRLPPPPFSHSSFPSMANERTEGDTS